MAVRNSDPMARQIVYDEMDVSDLKYSSLDEVVKQLTELQAEGYTGFDVEIHDDYGSSFTKLKVTRKRLETDEEYSNRMRLMEASRERRRQEYLKLREEFGNEGANLST